MADSSPLRVTFAAPVTYRPVGRDDVDRLVAVYRAVFTLPPYDESEEDVEAVRRGLPAVLALEGFVGYLAEVDARAVGMAYGHVARPGQWWYDLVERAAGRSFVSEWVDRAFSLAEMAVVPAHRRRGIGRRLHDLVLAGADRRRAVLATLAVDTPASRLYEAAGWRSVFEPLRYRETGPDYRIMALDLEAAGRQG